MPHKFFRLLSLFVLLGCGHLCYAQQSLAPTRLYKQADGRFTTNVVASKSSDKIVTARPLIIRARYYSKSSAPSILILNLVDKVNNLNMRYPVALIDKNTEGDVILYGPQLYDGREELRVIPEILVLKSEQFAKYKGMFDKYFGTAAGLLPVVNQASKFIDIGWKTAEDFYGKDKTETFTPILISRDTQQPLGTWPSWYVLANKDAESAVKSQLAATGFRDPSGGDSDPGLTPGSLQGGRVVFISVMPANRALTVAEISERIDRFFGTAKERLDSSKLATNNPFAGEEVQANLSIRSNFETFLSTIELTRAIADTAAAGNPTVTTEGAVSTLFANFKAGQLEAEGTPFLKLKPANDQQVASVLTRLFEFKDQNGATPTGPFEEPGLRSIMAWSNWLERRTRAQGKAAETLKFKDIKGFVKGEPASGAYVLANPNYAIKNVSDLMPTTAPKADAPIEERLKAMRENIRELRKVKAIFNSTDTNPWLRNEQREVARWLVSHLRDKEGAPLGSSDKDDATLRLNPDFKSDDDVKTFADTLDEFLATATVFEPVDLSRKVWRFRPVVDFVDEKFRAELRALAGDAKRPNKHDAIIDLFRTVAEPSLEFMSKEEKESFASILVKRFPPDLEGKSLSLAAPKSYFDNTILTATLESGNPLISTARDSADMLKRIAFTQSIIAANTADLSEKLKVPILALNQQRKSALDAVFVLIRTPNIDFSTAMQGVNYVARVVAIDPAPVTPTNSTALSTWISKMAPQILNAQWNADNNRFMTSVGGDPEVERIKEHLGNGCDRSSATSMSACVEPSGNGMTGKELIKRLHDIICDVAQNSAPKRAQAEDLLRGYIDVPDAVLDASSSKCNLYKDTYSVEKLEWRKGMYRLVTQ